MKGWKQLNSLDEYSSWSFKSDMGSGLVHKDFNAWVWRADVGVPSRQVIRGTSLDRDQAMAAVKRTLVQAYGSRQKGPFLPMTLIIGGTPTPVLARRHHCTIGQVTALLVVYNAVNPPVHIYSYHNGQPLQDITQQASRFRLFNRSGYLSYKTVIDKFIEDRMMEVGRQTLLQQVFQPPIINHHKATKGTGRPVGSAEQDL